MLTQLVLLLSILLAVSIILLCLRFLADSQLIPVIVEIVKQVIVPRLTGPLPPM